MMDLGSMTLSDLRLLRDRLGVLAEAGQALLSLPGDGCAMRFDLTPDELVVITTHWRAPSASELDQAPEFEVVDPETPLAAVEAQGVRERIVEMFAGAVPPCAAPSEINSAAPTPAAETVAPATPAEAPQPTPAEAAPEAAPAGARAGMPWTAADDQRLEQLRSAGKSVREIAGALGRPVPATQMRLSRLKKAKRDTSGPAEAAPKSVAPAAQAEAPKRTGEASVREAAQKIPAQSAQAGKAVSKPAPVAGGAGDHSELAAGGVVRGGGGLVGERQTQDVIPPRPAWFREIDATLTAIGYRGGFTPAIDLAIVECIAGQNSPEVVADELGMEVRTMRDRFVQLTPDCVDRHGRRKVTVEDQQRLLEVLRARVKGGAK